MRVLVTGAGGFVGSAVLGELLRRGATVRAHLGPPGVPVVEPGPDVETHRAPITDGAAVGALCARVDAVVHLAGPPSVAASFADPVSTVRDHVLGTATVAQACREQGVGRLVYVSSAEVYGDGGPDRVAESAPVAPRSPYGSAKFAAESLVRSLAGRDGLDVVVLRPFSVYGARSPAGSLVGRVLAAATAADEVAVISLRPVRDYVHVDDVARAVRRAVELAPAPGAPVWNVGSGTPSSVLDVVRAALRAAGREVPVRETGQADRPGAADVARLVADPTLAARELGWVTSLTLEAGLAQALQQR